MTKLQILNVQIFLTSTSTNYVIGWHFIQSGQCLRPSETEFKKLLLWTGRTPFALLSNASTMSLLYYFFDSVSNVNFWIFSSFYKNCHPSRNQRITILVRRQKIKKRIVFLIFCQVHLLLVFYFLTENIFFWQILCHLSLHGYGYNYIAMINS